MIMDEITQGDGNCFPRAVMQQCKRQEIKNSINKNIKMKVNHFMSIRNAVCDFMLNVNHPCIETFRHSYMANEYPVSRISWNDYWFAMRQNNVWVDYKFIQGTAWYLSQDIMIVTTKSTPENPYIYISGNKKTMSIPCVGVPLLIGSELDWHFQSLLPEIEDLVINEDNFPPLTRMKNTDIKMNYQKPNLRQLNRLRHVKPTFQDAHDNYFTNKKYWKAICPNCQKKVASIKIHFLTSMICKQSSLLKDNNKHSRSPMDRGEISKKMVTEKKSENTRCKGCNEEHKSIVHHLKRAFPCQNMYGINETLGENICKEDDYAPNKTFGHNRKKNNKIETKLSKCAKQGREILLIEKANKYTLKPSMMKVSIYIERKEPLSDDNCKNKSHPKKSKFNCKFFKDRICFNSLCRKKQTKQTKAFDICQLLRYKEKINQRLRYLDLIRYAEKVDEFVKNSCNDINFENTDKVIKKSTNVNEIKCIDNIDDFERSLESYCGNGPKVKKIRETTSETSSNKLKPAFIDICVVDSLINMFMSMNIEKMRTHIFHKDHKDRCALCILRSAIYKTRLDKGPKNAIDVPEIKNNLQIFLGTYYCVHCFQQFDKEDEEKVHTEENNHGKKGLSLKKALDKILFEINIVEDIHLPIMCTECERNINTSKNGYIELPKVGKGVATVILEAISEIIDSHQRNNSKCHNGSYEINKYPETLMFMMHPNSITVVEEQIIIRKEIYELKAQVSYKNEHFYTRCKIDGKYYKMDGNKCIPKTSAANPKHTMVVVYQKKMIKEEPNLEDLRKYIYSPQALRYFRRSTEKYKDNERKKYHEQHEQREKKLGGQRAAYDQNPEKREEKLRGQRDQKKTEYDQNPEKREEKLRGQRDQKKRKYDAQEEFRNKRKQYSIEYYEKQDKILKLVKKNFDAHDSGMDFLCVSCLRLHNRMNVSKYKSNRNGETDNKLLLIEKSKKCDGNYYVCKTCRTGLIKRLPKMNFKRLQDIDKIGSIPNRLPDLNLMEQYLLKLTIPFIRVAHVPRTPNLKLVGGSVCIQANVSHSIERLQINPENIIPVSFKRKLIYKGYYMEQVVNKEKIFEWLLFLKQNNPLYENITINETEINDEIDLMDEQLISELVTYDEYRLLKDQLDEKKASEEKIITEDLVTQQDLSDSDTDDDENSGVDALTEAIHEKEAPLHDTFMYHVNELCMEEKTVTNGIAKFIYEKEKNNFELNDEFYEDQGNFLFKNDSEEEDIECEEIKSSKSAETITKRKNPEDVFSKSFVNKSTKKGKKGKEKEKATVVAPGENQQFDNTFKLQEEKCFPTLFVKGQSSKKTKNVWDSKLGK